MGCTAPLPEPPETLEETIEETTWQLAPISSSDRSLEGVLGVERAYRSNANDWSYLLSPVGDAIHTLTAANVQPRGSYCVGGDGDGSDCTGVIREVGTISIMKPDIRV